MELDKVKYNIRSDKEKDTWIPEDSYILTNKGWRPLWAIQKGEKVITNTYDGNLGFDIVKDVKTESQQTVLSYHGFWEFETGSKHKWFGFRRMTKSDNTREFIYDHKPCLKTTKEFYIKNCGVYEGMANEVSEDDCRVLGWILSDGYVKWKEKSFATSTSHGTKRGVTVIITQNDNKYGDEIKELLVRTGSYAGEYIRVGSKNICRNYRLKPAWFRKFWVNLGFGEESKHSIDLVGFLLRQPKNNIEAFLDAFFKADGHIRKGIKVITQNQNNLSEGVLLAGYLLGYNVSSGLKGGIYINKRGEVNTCKWYKLRNKPYQTTMKMKTKRGECKRVVQLDVEGYCIYRQHDTITCA